MSTRHQLHRLAESLCDAELDTASGGMLDQLIQIMTNLANKQHETLQDLARSLRG